MIARLSTAVIPAPAIPAAAGQAAAWSSPIAGLVTAAESARCTGLSAPPSPIPTALARVAPAGDPPDSSPRYLFAIHAKAVRPSSQRRRTRRDPNGRLLSPAGHGRLPGPP